MDFRTYSSLSAFIVLVGLVHMVPAALLPATTKQADITSSASVRALKPLVVPTENKEALLEKFLTEVKTDEETLKQKYDDLTAHLKTIKTDEKTVEKELKEMKNLMNNLKEERELAQKIIKLVKKAGGVA